MGKKFSRFFRFRFKRPRCRVGKNRVGIQDSNDIESHDPEMFITEENAMHISPVYLNGSFSGSDSTDEPPTHIEVKVDIETVKYPHQLSSSEDLNKPGASSAQASSLSIENYEVTKNLAPIGSYPSVRDQAFLSNEPLSYDAPFHRGQIGSAPTVLENVEEHLFSRVLPSTTSSVPETGRESPESNEEKLSVESRNWQSDLGAYDGHTNATSNFHSKSDESQDFTKSNESLNSISSINLCNGDGKSENNHDRPSTIS